MPALFVLGAVSVTRSFPGPARPNAARLRGPRRGAAASEEFSEFLDSFAESSEEVPCLGRRVRLLTANGRRVGLHWAENTEPPEAYEMTEQWEASFDRLVHVWPHFWMGKNRLVRSMMNAIFGFYDRRVYARNTRAARLAGAEREEGRRFIAAHHLLSSSARLPGGRRSSLYGLRADGELLAVALFGRIRRHRCEVLRFCTGAGCPDEI
eukprot:s5843_g6.t1